MNSKLMPVLFIGHGSPMNAIENNEFSLTWEALGKRIPTPRSIVCVSAHWETQTPRVTAMNTPQTIHDFGGFPAELFEKQYPAPGNPALAESIIKNIPSPAVQPAADWGLDHGSWSVLCRMYPDAKIPVLQFSLARTRDGQFHYDLGRQLRFLREEGVLILGSGNVVHNLMRINWDGTPFDWAVEFDGIVKSSIAQGDHQPLIHFEKLGVSASLAINSAEHYLPLLYMLGAQDEGEPVEFLNESIFAGSISMRCVVIGEMDGQ